MKLSKTHYLSFLISIILLLIIIVKLASYFIKESNVLPRLTSRIVQNPNDIEFGNSNAEVVIFLFGNYKCSHCVNFLRETAPKLTQQQYNNKDIKIVLKLVPFSSKKDELLVYKDALCINKYGEYDKFHQMLLYDFELTNTVEYEDLMGYIMEHNNAIASCRLNNNYTNYITNNQIILKSLGYKSTPVFVIDDRVIVGNKSYLEFLEILNEIYNR